MMTSKYIGFFLKEISAWQKTLGVVDTVLPNVLLPHLYVIITVIVAIIVITACEQVIGLWMEVQRTWSYLESIFIGSEDIRKQLPEDSDRRDIVFLKTLLHVGQENYQPDNRFDRIDKEFKGMMTEAKKEKNVIRATGVGCLVFTSTINITSDFGRY